MLRSVFLRRTANALCHPTTVSIRGVNSRAYVESVGTLKADLKKAMLAKDDFKKTTIRGLLSGIKNKEIDSQGKSLDEFALHDLYSKLIAQRTESIKQFEQNNRPELIDRERKEAELIQRYLSQLPVASKDEVDGQILTLLQELQKTEPSLQLKEVFGKVDWKSAPMEWKASAAMIRASIASQYKKVF
ncbi:LAME_0F04368g1_1 [Lachancea meyersii CBS 8951]|uniref:Altered inheritance of mitochondria protein 41 n=1 Tax=Lachancea meyersii CBS 8951 TaxID=1266667 RepID=A0A1G4JSC0_9SACH|nr:LAME_0F04368g1_1 [Lachancea meyersii CBS 8951]